MSKGASLFNLVGDGFVPFALGLWGLGALILALAKKVLAEHMILQTE